MVSPDALIPLSQLEAQLGISRVDLLAVKRLPVVLDDGGHPDVDRHGLRFHRMRRPGQRLSWKVSRI